MGSRVRNMRERPGVTLTEVLVAMFVAALGLMGILALFPVAILNMAQAIKDDQAGHCAANAKAIATIWDIRTDSMPTPKWPPLGAVNTATNPNNYTPYWSPSSSDTYRTTDGQQYRAANGTLQTYPSRKGSVGPSYPVYIDPAGFKAYTGQPLGGIIPRRSCRFLNDSQLDPRLSPATTPAPAIDLAYQSRQIARWFSLLDDINFGEDGTPDLSAIVVQRRGQYSWAYMCYMPSAASSNIVDMSVVVYSGRSLVPGAEMAWPVTFTESNVLTLTYNSPDVKPAIRKGGWILEAGNAPLPPPASSWPAGYTPPMHAYFYRVVNVVDPGLDVSSIAPANVPPPGGGTIDLELQTDIIPPKDDPNTVTGRVIVMENVEEVFEAGTGPSSK